MSRSFHVKIFQKDFFLLLEYKIAKLTMYQTYHNPKGKYKNQQCVKCNHNPKSNVGQHRPPTNAKVGSGAAEK
jgi:hypothetical protein